MMTCGIDINATDDKGQTALHHALLADKNTKEIVAILLKNNINVLEFRLPSECVLHKLADPNSSSLVDTLNTDTTDW